LIRVRRHMPSFVALAFVAFVVAAWAPGAALPPLPSGPLASPVQGLASTTASAVVEVPAAIEAAFAAPTPSPSPSASPSPAATPAPTPVPPQPDSGGISGGTIALVLFTVGVALVGVVLNALYRRSQRAA
jgi:hypothetical protein